MSDWDYDAIIAESAHWVSPWVPSDALEVQTEQVRLYVREGTATVLDVEPGGRTPEAVVDEVLELVRPHGAERVAWTVGPSTRPAGLPDELLGRGGTISLRLDIRALEIGSGPVELPVPNDVDAHPVATRADVRAKLRIDARVWGGVQPTEADVEYAYDGLIPGPFVAYLDGQPAGAGGYTLAGKVARLWGAAVLPEFRGNGVYRALVDARVKAALTKGATLALVHANVGTSGPILRQLGFRAYGQRQIITVPTR